MNRWKERENELKEMEQKSRNHPYANYMYIEERELELKLCKKMRDDELCELIKIGHNVGNENTTNRMLEKLYELLGKEKIKQMLEGETNGK